MNTEIGLVWQYGVVDTKSLKYNMLLYLLMNLSCEFNYP